jgi:hypothetical protein
MRPVASRSGISTASQGASYDKEENKPFRKYKGKKWVDTVNTYKNPAILTYLRLSIVANKQHTPSAIACAIPNLGTFLAHRGLKWSVRQILPPLKSTKKGRMNIRKD